MSISMAFLWRSLRNGLAGITCVVNVPLFVISLVALARGSGGSIQVVAITLNGLALLCPLLFVIHMIYPFVIIPGRQRYNFLFVALASVGFVNAVTLSARAGIGGLSSDYASVGDISALVLALAWFAVIFAVAGLAVSLFAIPYLEGLPRTPHNISTSRLSQGAPTVRFNGPTKQMSASPINNSRQLLEEGKYPNGMPITNVERWPEIPFGL
uniref:Uncharacterized protein n=1 Tax=Psilocybe cubensis TaxID=181762 RepID=A0A8H7Y0B3_PSICU